MPNSKLLELKSLKYLGMEVPKYLDETKSFFLSEAKDLDEEFSMSSILQDTIFDLDTRRYFHEVKTEVDGDEITIRMREWITDKFVKLVLKIQDAIDRFVGVNSYLLIRRLEIESERVNGG